MRNENEFRIGNLITDSSTSHGKQLHPGILKIIGVIAGDKHVIILENGFVNISTVEPIPLTKKWLKALGFEKKPGYYILDRFVLLDCVDGFLLGDIDLNVKIKYVHQLQNLYFALTGEELY